MLIEYFIPVLFIYLQCVTALLSNTPEDALLETCELVNKYSYSCEEYKVTTKDGYINTLFHIPGDPTKPVYLQHGFIDSSYTWIIRGPNSPALWLANNSYDVWMGNTRGNMLSRAHVTLNPDELLGEYWDFSFPEMALYDVPAMIDFILEKTGQAKLQVVAHSQGTSLFFVLGSIPEYGSKIKNVLCLAPIARLNHIQFPLGPLVSLAGGPLLSGAIGFLGRGEFLRNSSVLATLVQLACTQGLISYPLCGLGLASVLFGPDPEQFEPEFAEIAFHRYPAGSSMKNAVHLLQILEAGEFQAYDYGPLENLKRYKTLRPPVYNLTKVPYKISLYVGRDDRLSTIEDVEYLKKKLSNVVEYRVMEPKWNHVDFVWGNAMPKYLFGPMLETLKNNY